MRKKWRIYPRGAAFWVSFGIISGPIVTMLVCLMLLEDWTRNIIPSIIAVTIAWIIVIASIIAFLLANISIDENDCLNMPFFCKNLMPLCSEKKRKIILKKNLIDVHLLLTYVYTYLGFEDENGDVTMINVTLFSKKQQEILQHKLEEYKKEEV